MFLWVSVPARQQTRLLARNGAVAEEKTRDAEQKPPDPVRDPVAFFIESICEARSCIHIFEKRDKGEKGMHFWSCLSAWTIRHRGSETPLDMQVSHGETQREKNITMV